VTPLDRVIAVVNDEAVTQYDVNEQKRVVLGQMKAANVTPPTADVLEKQLLERLITERVLMQYAKETGIRVDDTQVERALARIAEDNKLSAEDFRKAVEREGIPYAKYRSDIRNEITVQRLREREVEGRVSVSDAEVDYCSPRRKPRRAARSNTDSPTFSCSCRSRRRPTRSTCGSGARRARCSRCARAPTSRRSPRASRTHRMPSGRHARLAHARAPADGIRRPGAKDEAGRRIFGASLRERLSHRQAARDSQPELRPTVLEQTQLRHILIKVNETTSNDEAKIKLERIRERIEQGAKFEDQAKANSEDASAPKGGDLGWVSPGDTVPDFERAMNELKPGVLSAPVRRRSGGI
jgi:peptidyl-prolyl cis-trans isomerase SurA